jgi:hypothetical protein
MMVVQTTRIATGNAAKVSFPTIRSDTCPARRVMQLHPHRQRDSLGLRLAGLIFCLGNEAQQPRAGLIAVYHPGGQDDPRIANKLPRCSAGIHSLSSLRRFHLGERWMRKGVPAREMQFIPTFGRY